MFNLNSMTPLTNRLQTAALGMVVIILLSGCINTNVAIRYTPQTNAGPVAGATGVPVNVDVEDVRLNRSVGTTSTTLTEYGDYSIEFFATNDIALVTKQAIEAELTNRGFRISEGGVTVLAGVNKFYYDDDLRLTTLILSVQVRTSDGTVVFSKLLTDRSKAKRFERKPRRVVEAALNRALKDCVAQLFDDPSFIDAILKASGGMNTSIAR